MPDVLFILLLALVIFGPKRLPEIARQLAKWMAQFRMMRDDLKRQLETELMNIELEEKQKAVAAPALAKNFEEPVPARPVEALPEGTPSPAIAKACD